ncbi:metallophosphoesterase family protein [Methylobacterium segetis]|uniref:metallophosphoesterase family protein n=1 Tax=Methylobacterium segetis TaxID=2488750 RepID=UPI0010500845|nr:metallophosphoesterase family protein [Methylobacterium segetis]
MTENGSGAPSGRPKPLTYAVGDIHGCSKLLQRLLSAIETHRAGRPYRLVFLGNYVDRGPDSASVIRILRELQQRAPDAVICLLGNHEELMLQACEGALGMLAWRENGGGATLASYGVDDAESLPHSVFRWLSSLPTVHEDARHYYVHAGFRPGRPGIDLDVKNRLWIREPFLSADYDFGKHIVHGHTPRRIGLPEVRSHRTNLDTDAVGGGNLTAGVFDECLDLPVEFLQISHEAN